MAESRRSSTTGRQIAASAFWVGAVAAILVLAAWLRSEPPPDDARVAPSSPASTVAEAPASPAPPAAEPVEPIEVAASPPPSPEEPPPGPIPEGPSGRLAERALADAARLARSRDAWTAQIAVLCDPAGAQTFVARVGADPRLHVLPAEVTGRSCFRICWGAYPSREEASLAPGLPRALLGGQRPAPRRVSEVVP